ncbi:hypothetical protein F9L33_03315 [Amylibacter sp. SFDW26]|uniref:hypothetical protein n=1 Tax=Amylibacter sp. SFDW26 TaxID=2652722 RepID=UPI001261A3FB|nr:hypothetical protein [Amylibacter sp. SFDW26]KAB7615804.1 hypothetical protein F9L33_03315 [Amylibacter sp. SFDW26]
MIFRVLFYFAIFSISLSNIASSEELLDRSNIRSKVDYLFFNKDFIGVDALADEYRDTRARTDSGVWKLAQLYYGLGDSIKYTRIASDKKQLDNITKEYLEKHPNSPTAIIARSKFFVALAWSYRGGGVASTVPDDAWEPFYENLKLAQSLLQEHKNIASSDPHWYALNIEIQKGLGRSQGNLAASIAEGVQVFPYYYDIYFQAASALSPFWNGSRIHIDAFARSAAESTKDIDGNSVYARIYWSLKKGLRKSEKLFRDYDVDWEKMKRGMEDIMVQYPDQWNIVNFAVFSCEAGDVDTTRDYIEQIRTDKYHFLWKKDISFEKCSNL